MIKTLLDLVVRPTLVTLRRNLMVAQWPWRLDGWYQVGLVVSVLILLSHFFAFFPNYIIIYLVICWIITNFAAKIIVEPFKVRERVVRMSIK